MRTVAHMFTDSDPMSEPRVGKSSISRKINNGMIAVGALAGISNMIGFAASPSTGELLMASIAAGATVANYVEGKRSGFNIALGVRGEHLFQELQKQAYVRRAANQAVRAIPIFGPTDPFYISEEVPQA